MSEITGPEALERIESRGFMLSLDDADGVQIRPDDRLSDEQRKWAGKHKADDSIAVAGQAVGRGSHGLEPAGRAWIPGRIPPRGEAKARIPGKPGPI
jgi:hypothetical protein